MQETVYDVRKIASMLPHRYPFLLVDRVISVTDSGRESRVGKKAVGIKCVTFNEPHFMGHFPDFPIMPGVLNWRRWRSLRRCLTIVKGTQSVIL